MNVREPPVLNPTDERMVPDSAGAATFWEHVYRYAFASRFVAGKRVLDIACGEGYGAAALQKAGASDVVGVDASESACRHARDKYALDIRPGTAEKIPLADSSVDLIVSFETIEHVSNPRGFLDECFRILAPGGRLVISTPDKEVYTGRLGARNPYHCSEMTESEFSSLLRPRFNDVRFYTQRPYTAAWWSPRSFVCENSPWRGLLGFQRLRRAIQKRISPEAVSGPTDQQRASVVDVILKEAISQRSLLNPYVVRPQRKMHREKAAYIVATAVR